MKNDNFKKSKSFGGSLGESLDKFNISNTNWVLIGVLISIFVYGSGCLAFFAIVPSSSQTIDISSKSNHSYSSNPVNPPQPVTSVDSPTVQDIAPSSNCPAGMVEVEGNNGIKGKSCVTPIDPIGDITVSYTHLTLPTNREV